MALVMGTATESYLESERVCGDLHVQHWLASRTSAEPGDGFATQSRSASASGPDRRFGGGSFGLGGRPAVVTRGSAIWLNVFYPEP